MIRRELGIVREGLEGAIRELKEAARHMEIVYEKVPDMDYLNYIDKINKLIKEIKELKEDIEYELEILE